MLSYPAVARLEASCDWLTLTFREDYVRKYVREDAHELLEASRARGEDGTTWDWMGFSGWSCAGVSWGTRTDCDILRLSGGHAELLFSRFTYHPCNCSRLDIALTFHFAHQVKRVASTNYHQLDIRVEPTAQRSNSLIVNTKGGETLYIGSRSSDQFGRVYDKGAEEGANDIAQRWRFEVEFKSERALAVLHKLTATKDRSSMYIALVSSFFKQRGVDFPTLTRDMDITVPLPVELKSDDRALSWLAKQVKPTIQRLMGRGREAEVYVVLGLRKE